jgi:4-diphosphocytidyl-2-C-methyl-D-erythritol kinase
MMSHAPQPMMAGEPVDPQDTALGELAPAKLNLTLEVLGRRPDGYHELVSLVAFADVGDRLCLFPHEGREVSLEVSGPFAAAIEGDNLVLRAARCFLDAHPDASGGRFRLDKRLPVAAGIGGGSSDAAAAVRLLLRANLADISRRMEALSAFAPALSRLGADIPVCLAARAAWMTGIGERVTPLGALPELHAVLVNPGMPLATRDVFAALGAPALPDGGAAAPDMPSGFGALDGLIAYLDRHPNDLEPPARALAPVIGEVLDAVAAAPGCRMARLSGSGPTCFGVFGTREEAEAAASTLARAQPRSWIAPARLA